MCFSFLPTLCPKNFDVKGAIHSIVELRVAVVSIPICQWEVWTYLDYLLSFTWAQCDIDVSTTASRYDRGIADKRPWYCLLHYNIKQ